MVKRKSEDAAFLNSLGQKLRRLRRHRGLKQRELSKRAGLSIEYLSRLEHGRGNPCYLTLKILSEGLGSPLGALFEHLPPPTPEDLARRALLKKRRMKSGQALLIFIRCPGAEEKSDGGAWAFKRRREDLEIALDIGRKHAAWGRAVTLCVAPGRRLKAFRRRWAKGLPCEAQQGKGPGERLEHAFRGAWARGAATVLAISMGSLTPRATELGLIFSALTREDALLGPTQGGDFYLVGLTRPIPGAFKGIPWGRSGVLEAMRKNLSRSGKEPGLLALSMCAGWATGSE